MRFLRWLFRIARPVSRHWLEEQQRRECSAGIDQSAIDWDAMKQEAFKR